MLVLRATKRRIYWQLRPQKNKHSPKDQALGYTWKGICFVGSLLNYGNYKYQITNTKQYPITEIQNSKPYNRKKAK